MIDKVVEEVLKEAAGGDKKLLSQLHKLRALMVTNHEALIVKLDTGELKPRDFANATNGLMAAFVQDMAKLIGDDKTEAILGFAPGEPVLLVDPDMMDPK